MKLLQESFLFSPDIFTDDEFYTRLELFKAEKKEEQAKQSIDFNDLPLFTGGEFIQVSIFDR